MYSDRQSKARPALLATSRLFQHIKEIQEDRALYEKASQRLYDATPDTDVAKRHGVLKAKINGQTPKPWMSMKRPAPTQASPSLSTPANMAFKSNQLRSYQSSPEEESAVPSPAPSQQRQSFPSDTPVPYSSGLFGRQHAAKRQHLPDMHASVSAGALDTPKVSPLSTPAVNQGGVSSFHVPDALDRFNARRGSRLSATTAPSKPAQQPLDALDRFNARKGFTQPTSMSRKAVAHSDGASLDSTAQVHTHSAPSDPHHAAADPQSRAKSQMHALLPSSQQPNQSAAPQHAQCAQQQQQQQTQRGLEALDRVNRRRGFKASGIANSLSTQGAATTTVAEHKSRLHPLARQQAERSLHDLTSPHPHFQPHRLSCQQASAGVKGQDSTAEDSQQSQCTSLESQHVTELRSSRPDVLLTQGSAPSHAPDALDRVNSLLLARRKSRTQAPAAGTCRASASPDTSVSSAHAVDTQVTNHPVNMSVDEAKASSSGQDDMGPPSGMVSSRLYSTAHRSRITDMMHSARAAHGASGSVKNASVVKKRMRAFDDDVGEDSMAGSGVLRKKAKAAHAVVRLHNCHTTGRGTQQGTVFTRLAQQCA